MQAEQAQTEGFGTGVGLLTERSFGSGEVGLRLATIDAARDEAGGIELLTSCMSSSEEEVDGAVSSTLTRDDEALLDGSSVSLSESEDKSITMLSLAAFAASASTST